MADQTEVPTWLVHVAGWGGCAALIAASWPALKWLLAFIKKKLEGAEAATTVTVNVGSQTPPPAGGPSGLPAHEMQALVEHAVETALANRQAVQSPLSATLPPGVVSMADVVTRRELADLVTKQEMRAALAAIPALPQDVVTRREMQSLANSIPIDPVTRREFDQLERRLKDSETQQQSFRVKVLTRIARMMERLKISIEEREDEDGNGG